MHGVNVLTNQNLSPFTHKTPVRTLPGQHDDCVLSSDKYGVPTNQNLSLLDHSPDTSPVRTLPEQHVPCQVIKMVLSPLTHQTPVRTLPGQHVSCQVIKMVFPQTKTSPPSLTRHLLGHCQDNTDVSCQVIKMVFPQTKTSPLTHQTPVRTLPGQHVSCQVIKMVFPQTKTSPPSLTRHLLGHVRQDNMCPVK